MYSNVNHKIKTIVQVATIELNRINKNLPRDKYLRDVKRDNISDGIVPIRLLLSIYKSLREVRRPISLAKDPPKFL